MVSDGETGDNRTNAVAGRGGYSWSMAGVRRHGFELHRSEGSLRREQIRRPLVLGEAGRGLEPGVAFDIWVDEVQLTGCR